MYYIEINLFHRERLALLKWESGALTEAMEEAISMHKEYNAPVAVPPDLGILQLKTYYNTYADFQDTNNLSLVSFLQYDGMSIIIPGDLEKAGWLKLLENPTFCEDLKKVNVFVASHHGRENGYYEEVFNYSKPDIVIISDKEIVHETQDHVYAQHANGIPFDNGTTRYVLTTRSDGSIRIEKTVGNPYRITIGV